MKDIIQEARDLRERLARRTKHCFKCHGSLFVGLMTDGAVFVGCANSCGFSLKVIDGGKPSGNRMGNDNLIA